MAATEREMAENAWDQVVKGINGARRELAGIRPRFLMAVTSGKPLTQLEDDIIDLIAPVQWTWPWFDEWDNTFADWRMAPQTWPRMPGPDEIMNYSPDDLDEYRRAAIAPLIIHTAAQIFFRDRHLSKAHDHQAWRLAYVGDPAEMKAAASNEAAIKGGDLSKMPPYFPGDRTRLAPQNPTLSDAEMSAVPMVPTGPGTSAAADAENAKAKAKKSGAEKTAKPKTAKPKKPKAE